MDKKSRAVEVIELIREFGYECALVGGLAVSVRARERFTRDVDFAVSVSSDREAEGLTFALQGKRYRLLSVIENTASGYLATARFAHPDDGEGQEPTVDLLFATTGIEHEIVVAAKPVEIIPGCTIPVARLPHLIAMKTLSEREGRERDRDDLRELLAAASHEDVKEARTLLTLIEERGYHRDKDLLARLGEAQEELRARQQRQREGGRELEGDLGP